MTTTRAQIYRRLLEACPEGPSPAGWELLPPDPDLRAGPANPAEILPALVGEFTTEDLQQAGVVTCAGGTPVIHPRLTEGGAALLVVRNAQQVPLNIITPGGCLRAEIPLLQAWLDERTRQGARRAGSRLFGVVSMDDVAVLRRLGLGAAPITDLDILSPAGLRRLGAMVGDDPFDVLRGEPQVTLPREYYEEIGP
ncbi:MAG: hypothetical protein N2B05_00935, partial [Gemmatimonadales bacterium]